MNKGENNDINLYLKLIGEENKKEIYNYLNKALNEQYQVLDKNNVDSFFNDCNLTIEECDDIKYYSGYFYKYINSVKRGVWDYDYLGNDKDINRYKVKADKISQVLLSKGNILNDNFITYRGVNISYFNNYGIFYLDELESLNNKFFIDGGFVSTTPIKENCYFKRNIDTKINYNVLIEYYVPKDYKEGMYLGAGESTSYAPDMCEYLLNDHTLSFVTSVDIGKDSAIMRMMVIPLHIYDDYYEYYPRETNNEKYYK